MNDLKKDLKEDLAIITDERDKITALFKKVKKGLTYEYKVRNLRGPVVFLLRNNMEIELYETKNKFKEGKFNYIHTDGSRRGIKITPSKLFLFNQKRGTFHCYFLHEDEAFPYPFTVQNFLEHNDAVQHSMSADMKWKTKSKAVNVQYIIAFAILAAVIIGGLIIYKLLIDDPEPTKIVNVAGSLFWLGFWGLKKRGDTYE